ncbi:hypothetical protein GCM10011349_20400 [Novosphingobium indicum]|uniref:DUF4031 domain-containing protein n=1 Tax=Novosphingobium indicum TaxID=462949 RepID=A0ABQ2JP85_9SPHN|nr:DUF4031 domain-containing protein [Novosphingobium indicum]GGN49597.1 hypothetical protein GCM10011349_20400 [Novosphingobium indicum]
MTVYVDDVRHRFGNMVMCHMWADTLDELLAMVDLIGVQRKWIQGHPTLSFGKHRNASWVHFDIALSKKALAIRHGAVLTDRYGPVEHEARRMLAWDGATPEQRERAQMKLDTVAAIRERDAA